MKKQRRSSAILYVLPLVLISGLLFFSDFVNAKDPGKNQPNNLDRMHVIGLINPDGGKSVWTVVDQSESDKIIRSLLEKYSSRIIERIHFYEVTSWEDMGKIMVVASEEQTQLILSLFQEVKRLKRRTRTLIGASASFSQQFRQLADKRNKAVKDGRTP